MKKEPGVERRTAARTPGSSSHQQHRTDHADAAGQLRRPVRKLDSRVKERSFTTSSFNSINTQLVIIRLLLTIHQQLTVLLYFYTLNYTHSASSCSLLPTKTMHLKSFFHQLILIALISSLKSLDESYTHVPSAKHVYLSSDKTYIRFNYILFISTLIVCKHKHI